MYAFMIHTTLFC